MSKPWIYDSDWTYDGEELASDGIQLFYDWWSPVDATEELSPLEIPGLRCWFRADSLTLLDGATVQTWTDSSGNGLDASQSVPANRPTFKTGIINGLPVVYFDDSNDYLETPSITMSRQSLTVAGVIAYPSNVATNAPMVSFYSGGNAVWRVATDTTTGSSPHSISLSATNDGGTEYTASTPENIPSNQFVLFVARADDTDLQIWRDGAPSGSATRTGPSTASFTGIFRLGWPTGTGVYLAEVLVFDRALRGAQMELIEDYLWTKYFTYEIQRVQPYRKHRYYRTHKSYAATTPPRWTDIGGALQADEAGARLVSKTFSSYSTFHTAQVAALGSPWESFMTDSEIELATFNHLSDPRGRSLSRASSTLVTDVTGQTIGLRKGGVLRLERKQGAPVQILDVPDWYGDNYITLTFDGYSTGIIGRTNLLRNPTLLIDTDDNGRPDWWGFGSAMVRSEYIDDTIPAYSFTLTDTTSRSFSQRDTRDGTGNTVTFSAYAGQYWTGSIWVRTLGPATVRLIIEYTDGTNVLLSAGTTVAAYNDWTRISTTQLAPSGTTRVTMYIVVQNSKPTPATYWLHAAQLEGGTGPTEFRASPASDIRFALGRLPNISGMINLLSKTQSDFDVDSATQSIDGTLWLANSNCTITHSKKTAQAGFGSMAITSTGAAAYTNAWTFGRPVPVMAGNIYTASAYFRADSTARSVRVNLEWKDSSDNIIVGGGAAGSAVTDSTSDWVRASVTAQAPTNAANAVVVVEILNITAANEVHYVDSVQLEKGSVVSPWVPGGTWSETADVEVFGQSEGPFEIIFSGQYQHKQVPSLQLTGSGRVFKRSEVYGVRTKPKASNEELEIISPDPKRGWSLVKTYPRYGAGSIQAVGVNGWGATDSFTLKFNGYQTISFVKGTNATAVDLEAGLAALPSVGYGNVKVSGSVGHYIVSFVNELAGKDVPPLERGEKNLLTKAQSDMESDYSGMLSTWVNRANATVSFTTTQAWQGTRSLLVTCNSAGDMAVTLYAPLRIAVNAGQTYTVSGYVRAGTTSRTCRIYIIWLDAFGAQISQTIGLDTSDNSGGWTRLSVSGEAPQGAATANIEVWWFGVPLNESHYLDGVQFEEGTTATAWTAGGSAVTINPNVLINGEFVGEIPAGAIEDEVADRLTRLGGFKSGQVRVTRSGHGTAHRPYRYRVSLGTNRHHPDNLLFSDQADVEARRMALPWTSKANAETSSIITPSALDVDAPWQRVRDLKVTQANSTQPSSIALPADGLSTAAVVPGLDYTASAYVYSETGDSSVRMDLEWLDDNADRTPLDDNPILLWHLAETSGSIAFDAAGGNNGTYTSSVKLGYPGAPATGNAGAARSESGADYVIRSAFPNYADFTVEAWVKVEDTGSTVAIATYGTAGTNGWRFGFKNRVLSFWATQNGGSGDVQSSVYHKVFTWHHVAAVVRGSSVSLYQDGELVGQGTVNIVYPSSANLRVGAFGGDPAIAKYFNDFALFDYPLSADAVAQHARRAPGKVISTTTGTSMAPVAGGWQRISVSGTAPIGAKLVRPVVQITPTITFSDDFNRTSLGSNWQEIHYDGSGSVTLNGSTVTVNCAGSGDFSGTSDTGSLITRQVEAISPFRVHVRVVDVGGTTGAACIFMLRGGTAANAKFFAVRLDSDRSHATILWRDMDGAAVGSPGENTGVPYKGAEPFDLRIDYDGATAAAYIEQGLGGWQQIGSRSIPGLTWVALTASSGSGTVVFDDFATMRGWIHHLDAAQLEEGSAPTEWHPGSGVYPMVTDASVHEFTNTAPLLLSDGFNRTSLGSNWREIHYDGSGSVTLDGSKVTIDSAGSGDFTGTSDTGSLIVRRVDATDPLFTAHVRVMNVTGTGAAHLLMLRSGIAPDSKFFAIAFDSDRSHVTIRWRDSVGGTAAGLGENTGVTYGAVSPFSLRIDYDGTTAAAYIDQGSGWQLIASRSISGLRWGALTATSSGAVTYDSFIIYTGMARGIGPAWAEKHFANLLTDSQAGGDVLGWTSSDSTLSSYTARSWEGSSCLAITKTGTAGTAAAETTPEAAASASTTYSASVYVSAGTTPRMCKLRIMFYNSSQVFISSVDSAFKPDFMTEWARITVSGTSPAGTAFATVRLEIDSAEVGETHFLDGAILVAASSAPLVALGKDTLQMLCTGGTFDFAGTSDSGSIVYMTATWYRFRVEAEVTNPGTGTGKQPLLMIRSGTASNTRFFALVFDTDGSHITYKYRSTDGGAAVFAGQDTGAPYDPQNNLYVAIEYDGSYATGYISQNEGATWEFVGQVGMSGLSYVALPETSHRSMIEWGRISVGAAFTGTSITKSPVSMVRRLSGGTNPTNSMMDLKGPVSCAARVMLPDTNLGTWKFNLYATDGFDERLVRSQDIRIPVKQWVEIEMAYLPSEMDTDWRVEIVQTDPLVSEPMLVDMLGIWMNPVLWEFSNDGGLNWVPALWPLNRPEAYLTFPSAGSQAKVRATAMKRGAIISGWTMIPWYIDSPMVARAPIDRIPPWGASDDEDLLSTEHKPMFKVWNRFFPQRFSINFKSPMI